VNVITTHDTASKNRNRVTRIVNGQISIIRDSIEWTNVGDHPAAVEDAPLETALFGGLGASLCSDFHGRGGIDIASFSRDRVSATMLAKSLSNFDESSRLIRRISSLMES
jgi:hypothetical protein